MLSDIDYQYQNISFLLKDVVDDTRKKALLKFPSLEKYSFQELYSMSYGLTSLTPNWHEGKIHADESDWPEISAAFSKIPHILNFSTCKLILDGINWFPDADISFAVDYHESRSVHEYPVGIPFLSNRIMHYRMFDDGRKVNRIAVCIEVTAEPEPRDSKHIIEKLIPWLGEPVGMKRQCLLSEEEFENCQKCKPIHMEKLKAGANAFLPESKNLDILTSEEKIPHVADKFALNKAFKNTGFERQKNTPNWLHSYTCKDEHHYLYQAHVQKLSTLPNCFRFRMTISGFNFAVGFSHEDYHVTSKEEALAIVRKIAEYCVKVRDEYGSELAKDFGMTPEWYYQEI